MCVQCVFLERQLGPGGKDFLRVTKGVFLVTGRDD